MASQEIYPDGKKKAVYEVSCDRCGAVIDRRKRPSDEAEDRCATCEERIRGDA